MARLATAVYLWLFFGLNVYRAFTQSFTTDEAYSYRLYIGAEPFNLLREYNANLHFLHTLATWATVQVLGLSEFTFRLPSLAGCALYFVAVHRLGKQIAPLAVLLLTAHPLLQDHMSAGRGYGLALAFFAWAFSEALTETPRLTRIAMFLALSIGTNLTLLFPAAALVAVLMLQRRDLLLADLTGPWVVFTTLFLGVPMSHMAHGSLYFGASTIADGLRTLGEYPDGVAILPANVITVVSALIFFAASATACWAHRFRAKGLMFLSSATLALTSLAVLASHIGLGMPYPYARTGIYFLFLLPLCALPLAKSKPVGLALAALAVYMLVHIDPRSYGEWSFDASTKNIIRTIEQRHKPTDPPVRISASMPMATTLEFYRNTRGLTWITAIETEQWNPGFDYYILRSNDFKQIQDLGLKDVSMDLAPLVKVATP